MKKNKNEYLLILGRWTSSLGNIIFDYANNVSIVSLFSNKPWLLAFYQGSETIVRVFFNLLGGVKADKGEKKRIIIFTDIISALICLFAALGTKSQYVAYILIATNALLALVYAFNSPTYKSIVKNVIERERIGIYNSISNGGIEVIKIAGPLVGVSLVKIIGIKGALVIDAITFFVSASAEAFLITRKDDEHTVSVNQKNMLQDIKEGFVYLYNKKQILYLIILSALVNFFLAGYNLLIPYTDIMYANRFSDFYSKVLVMEAVGGVLGSLIFSKKIKNLDNNIYAQIVSLGFTGITLVFESIIMDSKNLIICLLPFLCFGISLTIFNIQFTTYIQVFVNEDYLGRVFSIIYTVAVVFMPLGSLVFSLICDVKNIKSFGYVGGGITILAIVAHCLIGHNKEKKKI
ncbi:MAG: MFS transporter [Lachnospiraceae bacterium]